MAGNNPCLNPLLDVWPTSQMGVIYINPYRFGDAYKAAVLADSPTRYYRLGESSGTTAVDETGGADGTYVNSPTLGESGIVTQNTAADFDGINQRVDFDSGDWGSNLGSNWSVEFWVKLTATTAMVPFGTANSGSVTAAIFYLNRTNASNPDEGGIRVFVRDDDAGFGESYSADVNTSLTDGSWHHIVFTKASADTAVKIYFDGSSQTVSSSGTYLTGTYSDFSIDSAIAAFNNGGTLQNYSDATFDEFALYKSELSSTRVSAHYNAANNI